MEDWRKVGEAGSLYNTPLGLELSLGDVHSGTAFEAVVELPADVRSEIEDAWRTHGAYPVLRLMPNAGRQP